MLYAGRVLSIQRDDFPGLPWAGYWDLPGGGREPGESPQACLLREIEEELTLRLPPERLRGGWWHPSSMAPGLMGVFFLASLSAREIAQVRLGDEGQGWQMMPIAAFLAHERAVPFLKDRLRHALAAEQA
ncbi:NUDIX domain-containing protein [Thioclava sp. BHET1]|nr:NUDIX domain-containing protein [Thioclava sp. BHET1]